MRLWVVSNETGRPFPQLTEDDVLQFMVMEAVTVKVNEMRKEEQEQQKSKERRSSHRELRGLKAGAAPPGVK